MPTLRKRITRVIEDHLAEIVDETMAEYVRQIPAVARAPGNARRMMRAATLRATQAFLALYADPSVPTRQFVEQARAATVERAGELLDREDILEMLRIGRQTVYAAARRLVQREVDVSADGRDELERQLDAFLDELERTDDVVTRVTPDVLSEWLTRAEHEGPDIR